MNKTDEILCITQEECAEVSQAISKIFRFGFESNHPDMIKSNRKRLEEEVGDLLAMVDILIEKCIISDTNVNQARQEKKQKLKVWSKIYE